MPPKPLPESEKKVAIGARLRPALFKRLIEFIGREERTVSFVVEKALGEFLDRHDRPPAPGRKR